MRVRNSDTRDALADEFLRSTGADIPEGQPSPPFAFGAVVRIVHQLHDLRSVIGRSLGVWVCAFGCASKGRRTATDSTDGAPSNAFAVRPAVARPTLFAAGSKRAGGRQTQYRS
jgi:hypothetical protein